MSELSIIGTVQIGDRYYMYPTDPHAASTHILPYERLGIRDEQGPFLAFWELTGGFGKLTGLSVVVIKQNLRGICCSAWLVKAASQRELGELEAGTPEPVRPEPESRNVPGCGRM